MTTSHPAGHDNYGLVITRREGSEILASSSGLGGHIPHIEILSSLRVAEQLTANLQVQMGLRTYCLFVNNRSASGPNEKQTKYALMECLTHHDRAPAGYDWLPFNPEVPPHAGNQENCVAITEAFREVNASIDRNRAGPFARIGWIGELLAWAQTQLSPLGRRITGRIRQLNASSTFSLIRLETTGLATWFKATGEPNLHELPISVALARLFPQFVPAILAVHPTWNGWLSEEVVGTTLDELSESSAWERVAGSLAELQIHSMGRHTDLLENQCKDLRLPRIVEQIDPFIAHMAKLMAAQEKKTPPALSDPELGLLGNRLKQACSLLQALGFPDTLGHLDLNPGNILVSSERCVFLDWAEGCVTNPLITFEYLREHLRRIAVNEPQAVERLLTAYLRPWQPFFALDALKQATVVSPLVAVFAYAVGTNTWHSPETLLKPSVAGYFRSLTRRMYREMLLIDGRRERCPACA